MELQDKVTVMFDITDMTHKEASLIRDALMSAIEIGNSQAGEMAHIRDKFYIALERAAKKVTPFLLLLALSGCVVTTDEYKSLAESFDRYIKETKPVYLKASDESGMPPSVIRTKRNYVRDAEAARDAAFKRAGIADGT